MDTLNRLIAPASEKLRQLQKMVQDIKANDGNLINRLKRLKNKPAPKVPARDYQGGGDGDADDDDDDQWSEPEFENDIYEDPQDDHDVSYELPPVQQAFSPRPSGTLPGGEYIDSCCGRNNPPPRKPQRYTKSNKPQHPTPPKPNLNNDDDYINPKSDTDDDYVEPTENPPARPLRHGRASALKSHTTAPDPLTEDPQSPGLYEVPNLEVPEYKGDEEYEVCDPDDNFSIKSEEASLLAMPKPMPRELKPPHPSLRPRPDLKHRESNGPSVPARNVSQKPSATAPSFELKRPKIPVPQSFTTKRPVDTRSPPTAHHVSTDPEEANMLGKPWYAKACDRKVAEDTLIRSNKDGSFLVRQSSGQDAKQPYTLVVFYNGRVYNIPVRHIPTSQQYALGREKRGEERFRSVSHIIDHHQRNSLVLIDGQSNTRDATKLCYPVQPRTQQPNHH